MTFIVLIRDIKFHGEFARVGIMVTVTLALIALLALITKAANTSFCTNFTGVNFLLVS